MLRHVVLIRFAEDTADREVEAIFADLKALGGKVPGLLAFAAGPNVSPEGLGTGYGHAFTVDFADEAARDAYLIHSDHMAAGARLVAAADGGTAGLVVVDFQV